MKCTQVTGFRCDEDGERGGEIECDNEAVIMVEGAPTCARCRDAIMDDEPEFELSPLPPACDS